MSQGNAEKTTKPTFEPNDILKEAGVNWSVEDKESESKKRAKAVLLALRTHEMLTLSDLQKVLEHKLVKGELENIAITEVFGGKANGARKGKGTGTPELNDAQVAAVKAYHAEHPKVDSKGIKKALDEKHNWKLDARRIKTVIKK